MRDVTTQRGEDEAAVLPEGESWFTRPEPREPGDDAPAPTVEAVRAVVDGAGTPWTSDPRPGAPGPGAEEPRAGAHRAGGPEAGTSAEGTPSGSGAAGPGAEAGPPAAASGLRTGRRRRRTGPDAGGDAAAREDGFDPSDTGTWRVGDMVPGADGGRRHTTILRYLLGLLAVDRLRALTRWAYLVPIVGLLLLLVRPRWIGAVVVVLGVLLVVLRAMARRLIARRSLARRYRPVEDDLRAAVEAGKANLRGELERVGLPTGRWTMPLSVLRLARGSDRSAARSKLREVEIHRILPEAQLQRALKILDEAAPAGR